MKENEWESVLLDAGAAQREEKKKKGAWKPLDYNFMVVLFDGLT